VVIPNGDHGAGVVWPVQGKNSAIVARRMEGWGLYHLALGAASAGGDRALLVP